MLLDYLIIKFQMVIKLKYQLLTFIGSSINDLSIINSHYYPSCL